MSTAQGRVVAGITTSVDGYVTGPDDGPGCGLGVGGERLHNWVMGGPWTYEGEHAFAMSEDDKAFYEPYVATVGSGVVGRGMYDASGAWGGTNPFGGTLHVVTHRTEDAPDPSTGFVFVDDFDRAMELAREAAGDRDVAVSGGADVIRQALAGGYVDELTITTAPVVLGAGKRLFEGFEQDLDLEKVGVHSSTWATHVTYAVKR
jgi:dihydrofolate reductase